MAYRGNQQKFGGPSPWLQGCPPGLRSPILATPINMQQSRLGSGQVNNQQHLDQNYDMNNQLVNQLALANNLLSNAFGPKTQNVFGNRSCGSLLGNPPVNFNVNSSPMPNRNLMVNNMNLQHDSKRMRFNNQNVRYGNYQQRSPSQNRNNSNYSRNYHSNNNNTGNNNNNRSRDDNRRRNFVRKEKSYVKPETVSEAVQKAETNKLEDMSKDSACESSYDPASPTSDGGGGGGGNGGNAEETSSSRQSADDKVRAGHKRPRSSSPSHQNKDSAKGILQVTIQRGSQGRSVSKDGETGSGSSLEGPIFCRVCNVACVTQENFHKHMNSKGHKAKMDSFITLHEAKTNQLEARMKASEHFRQVEDKPRGLQKGAEGYCYICKCSYSETNIEHKRSKMHKRKRGHLYPICRKCQMKNFKNRKEYEEHCLSEDHLKACEEWNLKRERGEIAVSEDDEDEEDDDNDNDEYESLLDGDQTNDSVDKEDVSEKDKDFVMASPSVKAESVSGNDLKDSQEMEEENNDSDVVSEKKDMSPKSCVKETNETQTKENDEKDDDACPSTDAKQENEISDEAEANDDSSVESNIYNPNVVVGESFVVPLNGLFCKLCKKFYRDNSSAKMHCRSQTHFDNFIKSGGNTKTCHQKTKTSPAKDDKASTKVKNEIGVKSQESPEKAADKIEDIGETMSSDGNCKQEEERILNDIDEILGTTSDGNGILVHSGQEDKNEEVKTEAAAETPPAGDANLPAIKKAIHLVEDENKSSPKRQSPRNRRGRGKGKRF